MKLTIKKMLTGFFASMMLVAIFTSAAPVVNAQNTATDNGFQLVLNGEPIDTETSMLPTVSYNLVDAELPSDRIEIDESTLYSDQLTPATQNLDAYYTNEKVELTTFRDVSTFLMFYWRFNDGSQDIIAPINADPSLIGDFTAKDLIQAQSSDIQHKVNYDFVYHITDDLTEMYHLNLGIPTEVLADAKADVLRAEELFTYIEESDPDYAEAEELMDGIYYNYQVLADRYNNGFSEHAQIFYDLTTTVEFPDQAEENLARAEEVVATLPEDLQQRISVFYGAPAEYFSDIAPGYDIHGYATHSNEIYLIDTDPVDNALIYHEIGHIFDFQSYAYVDYEYEDYVSFSNSDEWLAILDAEWQGEDGFYYGTPIESFAQGFAGYVVQELEGVQLSDYYYEDTDIADRPLTYEYFDNLFAELGLEL